MANDESGQGNVATAPRPEPTGFDQRKHETPLERIQHVLHANPILGPLAVLLIAIIAFSIVSGRFLSGANLGLVIAQVTVIATLALGQTLIILTAGIDLSAGAIAVFSSILMANFATKLGMPGLPSSGAVWPDRVTGGSLMLSPSSSACRTWCPWTPRRTAVGR